MASVVVVGGGFAGISAAVRLAKLRHDVTLLEATAHLGGQLRSFVTDGYAFDHGRSVLTMPAALRDLFRKSGRQLERELELVHLSPGRRHVFDDRTVLDLPYGNRADQIDAIDAALDGQGRRWSAWLDGLDATWEVIRREALDVPFAGQDAFTRRQCATLRPRRTLRRTVRKTFSDHRLRSLALSGDRLAGQDPRSTPAFVAVSHLVERSFGRWQIEGGTDALLAALARRLEQRKVDVRLERRAQEVIGSGGTLRGVETSHGTVPCEVVVWAAPAPPTGSDETAGLPTVPPAHTYLGLGPGAPDLPVETLVHAEPPLRVMRSATHTGPGQAWTVEHLLGEDPLLALARVGIDVRAYVESRTDVSPVDAVRARGHADGWQWRGWRTALARPGVGEPASGGYHRVGVNAHPGPSLELVAMGTAAAATAIGKA